MKLLLLLSLWLLTGPAADHGQARSEPARLIIYRQREFGGNTYDIRLNDKKLGSLPTNRYLQVDVSPGRVKIESVKDYFSDNQTLWVQVQPGATYYVKAVEEVDFLSRTLLMAPTGAEQARRELKKIKPAEPAGSAP